MTHTHALTLASAPATEPLTLAETKTYLKIENTNDDTLITSLITLVRKAAEDFLCASLITQSWKISYDKYAPSCVYLPMGPIIAITSVTVFARDGSSSVMAASTYYLTSGNRKLVFDASPIGHRIEIIYTAGYGTSGAYVPSPIRYGMLAHLAAVYDGRVGDRDIPKQAVEFYLPYRGVRL